MKCPPDDIARKVLSTLPAARFAFAYGSAIFPQQGVLHPQARMVDLILAVDDAQSWHTLNMAQNPTHYTQAMRLLGASTVASTQTTSFGARVYYNTILPTPQSAQSFKYGVVAVADLEHDLLHWDSLYLSGRMHKPIRMLSAAPPSLSDAMRANMVSATSAALLSLPERFRETELYDAAAGLSYSGDVRMWVKAEVAAKVPNIVRPNLERFRELYRAPLRVVGVVRGADGVWGRRVEREEQERLLRRLPRNIRCAAARSLGFEDGRAEEMAGVDAAVVGKAVVAAVASVVTRSSIRQSVKGIATAGLGTSARYVAAKLGKSLRTRLWNRSKGSWAGVS